MKLLVASRNPKKLAELDRVLAAANITGIELVSLKDVAEYPETPETGATFEDNALIKSRDGVNNAHLPTVADDSGIAVDALNGMPGVLSARWSGFHAEDDKNNELLLGQLADVPDERRGAHYVSVCALSIPADMADKAGLDQDITTEGRWHGRVLREPKGSGGFGYDPLFAPVDEPDMSAAELSAERKDELSHRGKAMEKLIPALRALSEAHAQ